MRVLFLTYHLIKPSEAGAGRPWGEFVAFRKAGHEVTVVTAATNYMTGHSELRFPQLWKTTLEGPGKVIRVYAVARHRDSVVRRVLNYLSYASLSFLAALCVKKPDIVFSCTDPYPIMPVGLLVARLRRAKLILDERDLYPETAVAVGFLAPQRLYRLLLGIAVFCRHHADHIVAATPGIANVLTRHGIPTGKITVVPNAFAHEQCGVDTPSRHTESERKFRVVYAGGLGFANDIDTIVRTAEVLNGIETDYEFLIIGAGEKLRTNAGKFRTITFVGPKSRAETWQLICSADLCLHAIVAGEFWACVLSSKLFDYLRAGKPVVYAGHGDAAGLLTDSGAGIVVPAGRPEEIARAIVSLRDSPERRLQMGLSGRDYVNTHFSFEQLCQLLNGCIEKVCSCPAETRTTRLT